ncbi:MAG: hypothetical protein HQK49_05655 [Oligoflexia bacterium]|nr:hypothetical protein [Oligoflexia bacterium]
MLRVLSALLLSLTLSLLSFAVFSNDATGTNERKLSLAFPYVLKGIDAYVNESKSANKSTITNNSDNLALKRVYDILKKNSVDKKYLTKILDKFSPTNKNWPNNLNNYYLPADDYSDYLIKSSLSSDRKTVTTTTTATKPIPKIALHAFKFEVINAYHDFRKDDLFFYFFVTDGVIPMGKVTNIYRKNSSGDSFFLNEKDRIIYPLNGEFARAPINHLIVDYGIVDAMDENIEEMKKITGLIIDLVMAVYSVYNPAAAPALVALRKEVKNLSDALISMDADHKLVTDSFHYQANQLANYFANNSTFNEFFKEFDGKLTVSTWEYRMGFRLLKGE